MSRANPVLQAFAVLDQLDNLKRIGRADEVHLTELRRVEDLFAGVTGDNVLDAYRQWREGGFRRAAVKPPST